MLIALGDNRNEEAFISLFKEQYPQDWEKICEKWSEEEQDTPLGKGHPMQHPNVYMKEMYRNGVCRLEKQVKR